MQGSDGAGAQLTNKVHRWETKAATTAAVGGTTILDIDVSTLEVVYAYMLVATAALTAFDIQARAKLDGTFITVADAAGDYTTPVAPILYADSALTTATAAAHYFAVDVRGMHTLRIKATSGGTATVALEIGGN